jgi:hypothetical protein
LAGRGLPAAEMNGMTPNKRLTHLRGPLRDAWWSPSSQRGQWRGLARDAVAPLGYSNIKTHTRVLKIHFFPTRDRNLENLNTQVQLS